MNRSYKYRLYPNKQQRQALNRIIEIHRQLYNAALQERRHAWKRCSISVSCLDQIYQIKPLREFDEDATWLNFSSIQQTLRRLDRAFTAFFRRVKAGERPGYPRYKGKDWFSSVCYTYSDGIKLRDGRLYVQNVGLIRIFQRRPIPDDAKIKTGILKRDKLGDWYVIFQLKLPDPLPLTSLKPEVGIDMGLSYFASLSTGEQIDNPRWFRAAEEKLAITQRKHSRTKRGSKRNRQLRRQIAKQRQYIANQRRDFQHKLSTKLVNEFGFIAVEDLNIKGLCRSYVSKSMGDAAWGQFLAMLAYKASSAGCRFAKVNPNHTSQTCPGCGVIVKKSLSERVHSCPDCGYTAPRDVAAAQVVLARGKMRTASPCKGLLYLQVAGSSLLQQGEEVKRPRLGTLTDGDRRKRRQSSPYC